MVTYIAHGSYTVSAASESFNLDRRWINNRGGRRWNVQTTASCDLMLRQRMSRWTTMI